MRVTLLRAKAEQALGSGTFPRPPRVQQVPTSDGEVSGPETARGAGRAGRAYIREVRRRSADMRRGQAGTGCALLTTPHSAPAESNKVRAAFAEKGNSVLYNLKTQPKALSLCTLSAAKPGSAVSNAGFQTKPADKVQLM